MSTKDDNPYEDVGARMAAELAYSARQTEAALGESIRTKTYGTAKVWKCVHKDGCIHAARCGMMAVCVEREDDE